MEFLLGHAVVLRLIGVSLAWESSILKILVFFLP